MTIAIDNFISLSHIQKGDEAALAKYLNNETIQRNTLRIPFPYKLSHAKDFMDYVNAMKKEHGQLTEWAIRNSQGELIGGVGFSRIYGKYAHKDELGYWLGEPFRGQGIMTKVVAQVCEIGFTEFKLLRIEAPIFPHNIGSGRVLEKNGFVMEGLLRNYFLKHDRPVDVRMYAKCKEVG
jgi:RimJ/RimL family protein N-acetyltransferase